jgi:hypothetical protein
MLMRTRFMGAMLAAAALTACGVAQRAPVVTADEAKAIAEEAYIYGYSLMSVEMSRKVITNVEKPGTTRAPMGQFANSA